MWHPWYELAPAPRLYAFTAAAAATMGLSVVMGVLDRPLKARGAGIARLELARRADRARQILDAWGEAGRTAAAFQLGLDYLYLVVYSVAVSLGCVVAAGWWARVGGPMPAVGPILAWGMFAAGLLDAVENYALWRCLFRPEDEWLPGLAYWCAVVKFALLLLALAYLGLGGVVQLVRL
jgi:hypothetical protein